MTCTASYQWFYVIVHACCFYCWKYMKKHFKICIGYLVSSKVFYHTIFYDKYRFFVLFSFWFVIFVIICCDCWLQLLCNDLTIAMFLLAFLDISYSCSPFWLSFSLLQKHPGVFLLSLSLLSMVFVFCSCL